MTLAELKAHRAKIVAEMRTIIDKAASEKRELTTEENSDVDERMTEADALQVKIARANGNGESLTGRSSTHNMPGPPPGWNQRNQQQATTGSEQWRDATTGEVIQVLGREQRMADLYRSDSGKPVVGVGDAIRYLLTGAGGEEVRAALGGSSDIAGGYMLSSPLSAQIIDLARDASVVMQAGVQTVPMSTSSLSLVRVTGDPTMSWTAENVEIATSEATFGRLDLRAKKVAAIIPVSIELIRDAPNAGAVINNLLRTAIGQELDRVVLAGSGAGEEPQGILNYADVQELSSIGSIDFDDLLDAIGLVEGVNGAANSYILHPASKKALAKLRDGAANYYMVPPVDVGALQRFVTKKLGTGNAVLGDFSQVLVGMRSGIEIASGESVSLSDGSGFGKDQVLVKVRLRMDVGFAHGDHLCKLTGITNT